MFALSRFAVLTFVLAAAGVPLPAQAGEYNLTVGEKVAIYDRANGETADELTLRAGIRFWF